MTLSRSAAIYRMLRMVRNRLCRIFYRAKRAHVTAFLAPGSKIARDLVTEEYVFIGSGARIAPMTSIGRYTMLAPGVAIVGGDHVWANPLEPIQFSGRPAQEPTVIGRDVWIGNRVTIMRGVTIGDGAVIGASSTVTKDVPAAEVWAGVPARKLRDRFDTFDDRALWRTMLNGPLRVASFADPVPLADAESQKPTPGAGA